MTNTQNIGSRSVSGNRKHGLAWLPWLALLLLALIAALVYLLLTNLNDENDAAGVDLTDNEISAAAPNADSNSNQQSPSASSGAVAAIGANSGGMVGGGSVSATAAASATNAARSASVLGTVLFAEDVSVVDAQARRVVDNAVALARSTNAKAISVTGYTDIVGGQPTNGSLSLDRASSVATLLRSQLGSGVTVNTAARGEQDPVAPNTNSDGSDNSQGRQMNRRVLIAIG